MARQTHDVGAVTTAADCSPRLGDFSHIEDLLVFPST